MVRTVNEANCGDCGRLTNFYDACLGRYCPECAIKLAKECIPTANNIEKIVEKLIDHSNDIDANSKIRKFKTGATRDSNEEKLDFEGFLSPLVLKKFAEYMNKHRKQADGKLRDSDNWQKGIPLEVYMKSAWRHFFDWWMFHRGLEGRETIDEALCGLLFNVMGYIHEVEKEKLTK